MTQPDPLAAAEARRQEQSKEYGTWEATMPIDIGGARAFNPGDPVPVGHVERFGWDSENPPLVQRQTGAADATAVSTVGTGAGDQGAVQADEQSAPAGRAGKVK